MITTAKKLHIRLLPFIRCDFSTKNSLINATPAKYVDQRVALKNNIWRTPDPTHLVHTPLSRNPLKLI